MYSMTSLDESLEYNCIVEDNMDPIVKLCEYTGETPRKTALLSNKLEKGDLFALVKLRKVSNAHEGSWISISLDEITQLNAEPESAIEVVQKYTHRESEHTGQNLGCAICDNTLDESEKYRLIYGYHIFNFHEECYSKFTNRLSMVVNDSRPLMMSQII